MLVKYSFTSSQDFSLNKGLKLYFSFFTGSRLIENEEEMMHKKE